MEPIVQRLEQFITSQKLNPNKLSELLGYKNPEKLYRLFRVENAKPSVDILEDISNIFESLNMTWLLTGRGEMLKNSYKSAYTPTLTQLKEPENIFNKHLPHKPQKGFGGEFGRNSAGKPSKTPENNENPNVPKNQNTEEYNRLLDAKNEVITSLREQIEGLLREVDKAEQIAHEKERVIQAIQSQNPHQQQPSSKQTRRTG